MKMVRCGRSRWFNVIQGHRNFYQTKARYDYLLKKADLDPANVKSYRPTSNLSVVSKLLERLVSSQLVKYLKDNYLLPDLQ